MSAEAEEIEIRRAPRIKAEDVFQAADALLVDGHRPTIDRVRMKLGRGSPNTINDHLDAWWSTLGARLRDLPGQVLPGLPEPVTNSLLQLWNLAVREAHLALHAGLEAREANAAAASADVERRATELRQQEQAHLARASALEEALSLAREQLSAATRRVDTLDANLREREAEIARHQQTVNTRDSELKALRSQLDAQAEAHRSERAQSDARHEAAEARWLQELDRARQLAKDREKLLKELRAQLQAAQRDNAERTRTLERELTRTQALAVSRAEHLDRLQALLQTAAPPPPRKTRTPTAKRRRSLQTKR